MTYEEVKEGLTELLKNPDTALAGAQDFLDKIKPDYDSIETLTKQAEDNDKKIRDLQDTNMKLFLNQTTEAKQEPDEEEEVTPVSIAKEMFATKEDK